MSEALNLVQLEASEIAAARGLFAGAHIELVVDGVIAGNSPGTVWVDNHLEPRTALIWDGRHCFYLGGSADEAVVGALNDLFTTTILPDARSRGLGIFKTTCAGEDWKEAGREVFAPLALDYYPRVFYSGAPVDSAWREWVPEGFDLRPIDRDLLAQRHLGNMAGLVEEIEECWPTVERFLEHGFGTCVLRGDDIVSRCTAEYLSQGKCGIGILTEEAYQGKGLATLAALAFIERSCALGLVPHWDAWLNNHPSVAAAEKVHFKKLEDYSVFFGFYNPREE